MGRVEANDVRVLMIIHTRGHGGAENVFRWLCWQLIRKGVDVVAAISEQKDTRQENWIGPALQELAVPVVTFDKSGGPIELFGRVRALIKRARPDIVHSHLLDSNFYSSLACRTLSVPHVCTEHGDVAIKNSLTDKLKYVLLSSLSSGIACVSDAVRCRIARRVPFNGKIDVIRNGIAFSRVESSSVREEYGIPRTALLIGNIGNLYPVKGQRYLIEAFSSFLKMFPGSYLLVVGRGSELARLESHVDRLGLPLGRVIFTGFRQDIGSILGAIDIYVQASLSEGLPVALLEAASAGVPVVATEVGGVNEILGRELGVLVPAGSADALFFALTNVARDLDSYRGQAAAARPIIRERFSLDAMATKYVDLYRKILDARGVVPDSKGAGQV